MPNPMKTPAIVGTIQWMDFVKPVQANLVMNEILMLV